MNIRKSSIAIALVLTAVCSAQRYCPVWESYVASSKIVHGDDRCLELSLLYKKEGGSIRHTEHQMYLIGYVESDETDVLNIVKESEKANKKDVDKTSLLDRLVASKLAAVFATSVAARSGFAAQDGLGKYRDGGDVNEGTAGLKTNTFLFEFRLCHEKLFDTIGRLDNFDESRSFESDSTYYEDAFKILAYIPVNDSSDADSVADDVKGKYDFANFFATNDKKTQILYCKPLALTLRFRRLETGKLNLLIN